MSYPLKIMSFNMRTQCEADGINSFLNREAFIAEWLNAVKPDVIGAQEIMPVMRDWMVDTLDDYYVVGGGRGKNYDNEGVCVAFRKDAFVLYDCETFWLSPTPHEPGSRYDADQSSCPRVVTWVTLKPKNGAPFRFYNIHTDHVGKVARALACCQLLQKIDGNNANRPMKSFVTGDFNAMPDNDCIKEMTAYRDSALVDLSADSGETFHGFGKRLGEGIKIDYIFADRGTKVLSFDVFRDERNGQWLSDHYPIMATVEME